MLNNLFFYLLFCFTGQMLITDLSSEMFIQFEYLYIIIIIISMLLISH